MKAQTRGRSGLRRLALALAALLAATSLGACSPKPDGLAVGDAAPAFSLPSTAGSTVSLSDYQGKPVLLFFHMAVG